VKHLLWPNGAPNAQGETAEDQPSIEAFLVSSPKPAPCIVVCPGGGYWVRAGHEGAPIAEWLNTLGISAFVLNYRVKPYMHPTPLLDVQRAIRTVRSRAAEWNIDGNRIGVLGFSAGGHLASSAAVHFDLGLEQGRPLDAIDAVSARPDLLVLCYPVVTFQPPFLHEGSMQALIGEEPDAGLRNLLSGELEVKPQTPPTFLWHTANDEAVPVENSLMFALALGKLGIPYELHVFEDGHHGLGLAPEHPAVAEWTKLCANWFATRGWI
jgi:acetyl esterase/lipase